MKGLFIAFALIGILLFGCTSQINTPLQPTCPQLTGWVGLCLTCHWVAIDNVNINFTDSSWKVDFSNSYSSICRPGNREGENINYYYCASNVGSGTAIGLKRTVVDDTGKITEVNNYLTNFVLEPTNITYQGTPGALYNSVINKFNIIEMDCYNR